MKATQVALREVAAVSRIELAKAILTHPDLKIFEQLGAQTAVFGAQAFVLGAHVHQIDILAGGVTDAAGQASHARLQGRDQGQDAAIHG